MSEGLRMLPFQHIEVDPEVSRRGGQAGVAQELLHGPEIASALEEVRGEGRAQEVRVMAAPRRLTARTHDSIVSAPDAQCAGGVSVHQFPQGASGGERSPAVRDEQHGGLPGLCETPERHPGRQEAIQFLGERQDAIHAALATTNDQKSLRGEHAAELEPDDLGGPQARLVDQAQDHVVPVADEGAEIRSCQERADLGLAEDAREPLWNPGLHRQQPAVVLGRVAHLVGPAVEGPQGGQIKIERRRAGRTPALADPRFN